MHAYTQLHLPPWSSSSFIFLPSDCIFGWPSAAVATSQYSLRVSTVAWCVKWWYKTSRASLVLEVSILDLTYSVMTPLRTSLSRLSLGSMTSKKSVSCFLRNSGTENCASVKVQQMKTQCNRCALFNVVLLSNMVVFTPVDWQLGPYLTCPHTARLCYCVQLTAWPMTMTHSTGSGSPPQPAQFVNRPLYVSMYRCVCYTLNRYISICEGSMYSRGTNSFSSYEGQIYIKT